MEKSYNFGEHEEKIYKHWEESGFFNPDKLDLPAEAAPYTIVLPPPNVTGTLHAGHAGVLTFQDILIRYHRMKGERTLWVPGTDHAAIATQTKVEKIIKEEGETRHSLGREKFLERVRQFAQNSHDTIVGQCKRMGASLDWSREAYTLDETRNKAVNSVFKLMYEDGLIYRGERIVNWCPRCHSTLSDDETEHKESRSRLYYFKYGRDFPITIATTRPETKMGDTAVAVNPKDDRYAHLVGREFSVDFVGVKLSIKIIADRGVEKEFGAGALGVTPAHSAIDWKMAEENKLPIVKVIDEDGNIHKGFGEFSGKTALEARGLIVEKLRAAGLMEKEEEIDNNLSLCYRCDTPIEPLPSRQWFINVDKKVERLGGRSIKEICLEAVQSGVFGRDKIRILPERFEKSYFHWIEKLGDWCISRQIWFGHQVPVWYRQGEEEIFVGLEAPAGPDWRRDEDTLDTWFSSGMWTFSTLAQSPDQIRIKDGRLLIDSEDFRRYHPTRVLETAYDILFFWVARMIIMTTYAVNDIPFFDVYLQGLVLDEKGKKMSKSKGNVINPLDMIEKYGADATRLSLFIGSTPGNDMRLSEEKIAGFRNLVNKLWNVSRYILQSVPEPARGEAAEVFDPKELTGADHWILAQLDGLTARVSDCLDNYRFSEAGEDLRQFTWDLLADWYIEAAKFDRGPATGRVLVHVLRRLLKLWHPFIPFVSELIWQEFNDSDLIVEAWPVSAAASAPEEGPGFGLIMDIVRAVRNARAENRIEPGRKVKAVIIAPGLEEYLQANAALIQGLRTGIGELEIISAGPAPDKAVFAAVGEVEIYLLGAVDEAKEKERLQKTLVQLGAAIDRISVRLGDPNFIQRAPQAVVQKEKDQLETLKAEKTKIQTQLAGL